MAKYFEFKDLTPSKTKELEELLLDLNIEYTKYDYALEPFCQEEAEYRVEAYEDDENYKIKNKKLRDEIVDYMARGFFENEYFIDSYVVQQIASESIDAYIPQIEEEQEDK